MFSRGWAVKGLSAVGLRASNLLVTTGPGYGGLGPVPTLLTGMYSLAALRHLYWISFTNTYEFPVSQALMVASYNIFVDTFNTLTAVNALTSSGAPSIETLFTSNGIFFSSLGWKQLAGLALFTSGLLIETFAEETRKRFKKNPANKGKIDDTGLWSVVRHPNYLGYTLWRSGITLATGSVGATIGFAIFQIGMFLAQSIPALSGYMSERYGEQWTAYERRVPYKLVPGIL